MRRFFQSLLRLVFVLWFGAAIWTGWYASSHGFSRKWRELVTKELHKRGLEVRMRRMTLDPLRGLVARDVVLSDPRQPQKHFATIDRVVLDINYANLLHGEPFLNAVDLHEADLALPVDPSDPESPRVEISRLNARLLLPPHELYLTEAEARLAGVRITARGRLQNPQAFRAAPGSEKDGGQQRRDTIVRFLKELRATRFESGPLEVDVTFGGDAAEAKSLFADATIWAKKMRHGRVALDDFYATLRYRERTCEVTRCRLSDARGALEASGSYDFAGKKMALQLRSTLDLQALALAWGAPRALDEAVFYDPPSLQFTAAATFGGKPEIKVLGRAALKRFAYKSAVFESAAGSFSYDAGRWYLRDVRVRNRTGEIALDARQLPGDFRAQLQSAINPRSLQPLLSGEAAALLGEWDFLETPRLTLAVRGPSLAVEKWSAQGDVQLGRTRMRGIPLNAASARMRVQDRVVSYEDFKVERDEGIGTGTFAYDFARHEALLHDVKTRLNTAEVATWIGFGLPHDLAPYRFHAAPNVTLNGHIGHDETNLEVLVEAPAGMDYPFLKKTLSFPKISGRLLFTEGRLRISDLAGTLYAGRLRGSADISLRRSDPGYAAQIEAENVDFASLTKLYFNYDNSHGLLKGAFDFRGRGADARTLQGRGKISVVEGNVFAIPVLGPFSGILNGLVPGMGYSNAHEAAAHFEVRDGTIATDDFVVKGQGFDMLGGGQLFFLDDKIDFTIRLNAQGLPGVLLFPVSKLFEYVSDGSLSKPAWRPKRLPAL